MLNERIGEGIFAVIGSIGIYLYGGFDGLLRGLVLCVIIDYVTGLMNAYENGELSSKIGFRGIVKKIVIFLLVALANVIDHEFLGQSDLLRDGVILFYIANEGISIFENSIKLGVPVPEVLKKKFLEWHEKEHKPDGEK